MITSALKKVKAFEGTSLTERIAQIEIGCVSSDSKNVWKLCDRYGVDKILFDAATEIKNASAQIDVIIHAIGILNVLRKLMEPGEVIESLSLGAGNTGKGFDLMTNRRVAEFKFIHWRGKDARRQKNLFCDFFKLVSFSTGRQKELFLTDIVTPLRFLSGKRTVSSALSNDQRVAEKFRSLFGSKYQTVGEFYRDHVAEVTLMDLRKFL